MGKALYMFPISLFTSGMAKGCGEEKTTGEKIEDGIEEVGDGIEEGNKEMIDVTDDN